MLRACDATVVEATVGHDLISIVALFTVVWIWDLIPTESNPSLDMGAIHRADGAGAHTVSAFPLIGAVGITVFQHLIDSVIAAPTRLAWLKCTVLCAHLAAAFAINTHFGHLVPVVACLVLSPLIVAADIVCSAGESISVQ